jgi:hypothetical protein
VFEVKEPKVCKTDALRPSPSLMISINPNLHNLFHSLKLYLSSTSWSPKLSFPLQYSNQSFLCTPLFSHICFVFHLSRSTLLCHCSIFWWQSQFISASLCNFLHLQTYPKALSYQTSLVSVLPTEWNIIFQFHTEWHVKHSIMLLSTVCLQYCS